MHMVITQRKELCKIKLSQLRINIENKPGILLKIREQGWGGIKIIPPHLFYYKIYPSSFGPDDCTPPKCGELSEYTDSAHTEVEDLS